MRKLLKNVDPSVSTTIFNIKLTKIKHGIKFICSKYDLYSKSDALPDVKSVTPYYEQLIKKYCPGELSW